MSYSSLFITATGTDVGKTTVSKWLCYHLGFNYFKPIQSGTVEVDQEAVECFLNKKVHPSIYQFKASISPHQAAHLENRRVDMAHIEMPQGGACIVEGAGGVLVPINDTELMIDLIQEMNLPVLLVVSSGLGTLNHTLLTLEALRSRNIPICGVIMNGSKNPMNKETIETFGKVLVLDELEFMSDEELKQRVPSPRLKEHLGAYVLS
jgi:dethiobiotin synthetase